MPNTTPKSSDPTVLDRSHGWLLALVLLVALAVRVTGLTWGLPNEFHYFSYHPDESVVIMHSVPGLGGLDIAHGEFLPHFYNYGSLYLEMIGFAYAVAAGYHALGPLVGASGIDVASFDRILLIARTMTVLMGVGTVWATFALGRRLWGPATGLLAAGALALMPLHAQHSHFATVDVPATLWVTLALLFAAKALPEFDGSLGRNGWKLLAVSGVFVGLATATKYNCALAILAAFAAGHIRGYAEYALTGKDARVLARAAATTLGAAVIALLVFVAGCPGALLERAKFFADLAFEKEHVYLHPELYFQQTGSGFLYIIAHNLSAGMGWAWLAIGLCGACYAIVRRDRGDGVVGFFTLAYYVLIALAASRYARYEIPILPVLALWGARMLVDLGRTALAPRIASTLIAGAALASMAAITAWFLAPMTQVDTRDQLAQQIFAARPAPAKIAFATSPWFWSPALNPYFAMPNPNGWRRFVALTQPKSSEMIVPEKPFDVNSLVREKPDMIVLSEYEYYDRLRLQDPDAVAYCQYLQANYNTYWAEVRLPSTAPPAIMGMPARQLPHDMLYTNPVTLLFVRR